ncbi:hypothetical protein [Klebsiella pneumoniae]|uniref:hypothetical protein n=1 Tax=Klebsiella pneumoniae TaxID=573 RepID=UPI000A171578|nr:hypothetical protein [Klebsiella pneumoniae]
MIGYSAAIRLLDNGRYDKHLAEGMEILACIMEAVESGWITLNIEKQIIVWRWLVVAVFVTELLDMYGPVEVLNDSGGFDKGVIYCGKHGGMSIYPGPERFCLANHVESLAIEKFGSVRGPEKALQIYKSMLTTNQEGFTLSDWGRDAFETLHDSFIKQIQTKGIPDMPVMH